MGILDILRDGRARTEKSELAAERSPRLTWNSFRCTLRYANMTSKLTRIVEVGFIRTYMASTRRGWMSDWKCTTT